LNSDGSFSTWISLFAAIYLVQ